ncbi:FAD-binding protein [Caproiciproducens galactitolivorans]|uniref:FAD-binding protein n=1 Tax=Caproiciproducens galactitolivorans TaxID=642589 RepID=A0ABT4BUM4_9FIRM|nr:FAD-binding protein [Caproiciproducens galactitolivorans]MCY1714495.1 FAD-binding protein [Caproiciproducens galactitolivorans]
MKLLTIVHIDGTDAIEAAALRQRTLNGYFESFGYECESYLYGAEKFYEDAVKQDFAGRVYAQRFHFISAVPVADEISALIIGGKFDGVVIEESELANDIAVLLAAYLDRRCLTNVFSVTPNGTGILCKRLSYNNNLILEHEIKAPFVISLRGYEKILTAPSGAAFEFFPLRSMENSEYILSQKPVSKAGKQGNSKVLIACGMGVETCEEIEYFRNYAREHGFNFGVTRPVAIRGWAKLGETIGVSGQTFAPKICVTLGVSGAAAFYVGIENADFILSVNTNRDALIIAQSDAAIIDDYKNVCGKLLDSLVDLYATL